MTQGASARPWRTVVAADLHLTPSDTQGLARMGALLAMASERAQRLLLLGDLFDLWLTGAERGVPQFASLFSALRAARAAGCSIEFIPGNRDYNFTRADGAALGIDVAADEELDAEFAGRKTRFLHGDQLLTDDHGYQFMKRLVRSGVVRWLTRRLPPTLPLAIGRRLRRYSDRAVPRKSNHAVRIVPEAVAARVAAGSQLVVCGHVHRFERRLLPGGGELLVVPPFCDDGAYLVELRGGAPGELWRGGPDGRLELLPAAVAAAGATPAATSAGGGLPLP